MRYPSTPTALRHRERQIVDSRPGLSSQAGGYISIITADALSALSGLKTSRDSIGDYIEYSVKVADYTTQLGIIFLEETMRQGMPKRRLNL
jgi:hypothetical protein